MSQPRAGSGPELNETRCSAAGDGRVLDVGGEEDEPAEEPGPDPPGLELDEVANR